MVQRQVVIDHVGLVVSDLAASDRFYTEALKSLGFKRLSGLPEVLHVTVASQD
jgi:catechol 2,3-dioxygenase-like lactoylglutathione lyase family enzyme